MKAEQPNAIEFPETLQEVIKYFADDERAFEYMKQVRWPDGVVSCFHCGSARTSFVSTRKIWTCKECKKQFSIRRGTIFEDSPIKFATWIAAAWLIANAKNGISSYEIGRALGVCQKTGWFMLQRIRLAMQNGSVVKIGGVTEVDETFIGGKARNMHKGKRQAKGRGPVAMTPVQGLLERTTDKRTSRVILKHVDTRKKSELQANVREYVVKGSTVNTDQLLSYEGLADDTRTTSSTTPSATCAGTSTRTEWRISGACSSGRSRAHTSASNPSTFSVTSTSRHFASTSARTRTAIKAGFSK